MDKPLASVIYDVKVCIDEIAPDDAEFIDSQDNEEMDKIIASKILDAMRYVEGNADVSLIAPDTTLTTAKSKTAIGTKYQVYTVELPSDFMRLCYARLSSWNQAVSETIEFTDREYAMLHDSRATGTPERPKVAICRGATTTLELYSAKTTNDTVSVGIIKEPKVGQDANGIPQITISDKLYQALVNYVAGLTLITYGNQRADDFINIALTMMGINAKSQDRQ